MKMEEFKAIDDKYGEVENQIKPYLENLSTEAEILGALGALVGQSIMLIKKLTTFNGQMYAISSVISQLNKAMTILCQIDYNKSKIN